MVTPSLNPELLLENIFSDTPNGKELAKLVAMSWEEDARLKKEIKNLKWYQIVKRKRMVDARNWLRDFQMGMGMKAAVSTLEKCGIVKKLTGESQKAK